MHVSGKKNMYIQASIITSILLFGSPSTAQANANVDRYDAEEFMTYDPQTLYDVLENIPAANSVLIELKNSDDNRGFGSDGDQILINNKRVSGKENSLENELDNILAQDVDYVELVRGTRSDLDVQSKGLVINVVLKKTIESAWLWSVAARTTKDLDARPYGSVTYSNGHGALKYRIGLEHIANPTQFTITDHFYSKDQALTQRYQRERKNWYQHNGINGKIEYDYDQRTKFQISGLLEKYYVDSHYQSKGENLVEDTRSLDDLVYDWSNQSWELSGDVTFDADDNNHFKLLFISNRAEADEKIWHQDLLENNQTSLNYRLPRIYVTKENVIRANWKHQLSEAHSLDSGFEFALNERDENVQFIREQGDTYQSIEQNDIEEQRTEAFINYNYAISDALNLQTSLIYETSTLKVDTDFQLQTDILQNTDNQSSRTFSFLKPRVNLRYDLDASNQLRLNYQRTVSQLNLDDFVPEFNRDDERLEETNPNLKPEQRDRFSLSFETRWLEQQSSLTISPYYHDIKDLITEVPLMTYSGEGNIKQAKEYGVKFDSHFNLSTLGIDNTFITASYTIKDSEAVHPFTGRTDRFNGFSHRDWQLKINQNELFPGLSFTLTLAKRSPYPWARYDYQHTSTPEMTANGFIDYQVNKHLKIRLKGDHLLNRKFDYQRTRHEGLYTETPVSRFEHRSYYFESRYSLILTGQF